MLCVIVFPPCALVLPWLHVVHFRQPFDLRPYAMVDTCQLLKHEYARMHDGLENLAPQNTPQRDIFGKIFIDGPDPKP